jgi:TRAP-type uncharacterized transport system fused permease subunit
VCCRWVHLGARRFPMMTSSCCAVGYVAAKYALPAFLVPFAFVLTGSGAALLTLGSPATIVGASAISVVAVAALAVATGGWLIGRAGWPERVLCLLAALLLLYLEPAVTACGAALLAVAVVIHLLTHRPLGSTR